MNSGDDLVNHWVADLKSSPWKSFVYLDDSTIEPPAPENSESGFPGNSLGIGAFPLSTVQVGDRVRIVSLNCGEASNRLMGMGLMPAVVLEVVGATAGSVIVALQDQRLGLGAEMAQRIQVIDATQPLSENLNSSTSLNPPIERMAAMQSDPQVPTVKLRDAAIGSVLRVLGYEPMARDYKRRLLAMGLTPGTELRVTRHAPLGDPTEIEVRDFHLSLRKDEADALVVTPAD